MRFYLENFKSFLRHIDEDEVTEKKRKEKEKKRKKMLVSVERSS